MADDECRAEIEAVARALAGDRILEDPSPVDREMVLQDARRAIAALDRVRDVRGDDRCPVCDGRLSAGREGCPVCKGTGRVRDARGDDAVIRPRLGGGWECVPSPQGEDHERRLIEIRDAARSAWRLSGTKVFGDQSAVFGDIATMVEQALAAWSSQGEE